MTLPARREPGGNASGRMTIDTWPRIVQVDADTYHSDPCPRPSLTASIAGTLVGRSPLHAWLAHPKLGARPIEPTRTMDFGTVVHTLLFGAGKGIQMIDADNYRAKAAQEARDRALNAGLVPILSHELDVAQAMVNAIALQLDGIGIALDGQSEMTVVWEEESALGPVLCRGMMDHVWIDQGRILDLKTIRNAHPSKCQRHFVEYGYHIQWAAYTSALRALRPDLAGREDFLFLFVESEYPYCVTPVRPDGTMRELGERRWRRAVELWARCLADNVWPPYTTEPIWIEAPAWALHQAEMYQEEACA